LLAILRKATIERRLVRFSYHNAEGGSGVRTVEPMTLVYKGSAWYLFAYCRWRDDCRMFRLSRMRDVVVTQEAFERRSCQYDTYAETWDKAAGAPKETVELLFSARMRALVEDSFGNGKIIVEEDGSLRVIAEMPVGEWLIGWFLSYGSHLLVIRPKRVREAMRRQIARLQEMYTK
jgi:predicted DNA-binding transcriptional regulator YafY